MPFPLLDLFDRILIGCFDAAGGSPALAQEAAPSCGQTTCADNPGMTNPDPGPHRLAAATPAATLEAPPSVRDLLGRLAPARPVEFLAPGLIRTARLSIRPLREADRPEFIRVVRLSRANLEPWIPLHRDGESDEALFERQLEMTLVGDSKGTAWRRIAVLDDGRIAGAVNLNAISRGLAWEADTGWWISSDQTRRGLGMEAVGAMAAFALLDLPAGLGLHAVKAAIMPGNTPSIRLATALGFRRIEGPNVSIRIRGEWELHDLYVRALHED